MKTLIAILFIIMLSFSGCATQKACCPHKDLVIIVPTPMGYLPIYIEKGFLDKENEDDFWIDSKKYDKMMEEDESFEEDESSKEEEEAQPI